MFDMFRGMGQFASLMRTLPKIREEMEQLQQKLAQIVVRPPMRLQGLNFREMFVWLSASLQLVTRSSVDEQIPLPRPNMFGAL